MGELRAQSDHSVLIKILLDREHQGDLRESLLHTSGAQSDGLTATHGLFTGGEAAHVLRMTYARVAVAVSPVLK